MDDDSDDSPPPRPQLPTRNLPSRRAKTKPPPVRQTRATAAYFTSSTSASNTQISSAETDSHPSRTTRQNTRPKRTRRKPPAFPVSSIPANSAKRRRVQPPVQRLPVSHDHHTHAASQIASAGICFQNPLASVPWHTLPYHVWLEVFDFVAAPIRDPASRIDDVSTALYTLLSGARTCKATAEPALAALYRYPPFDRPCFKHAQSSFTHFIRTLELPPSQSFIRYRPKIQALRIDVDAVLSRKLAGVQVRLSQLLKYLPRLACLELYHPADEPPYRDLTTHWRWKLSKDDLLEGLGSLPDGDPSVGDKTTLTALRSWRWNSRFASDDLTLDHLVEIHTLPSFSSLRKLAYVNYQLPSLAITTRASQSQEARDNDLQAIAQLATSISALPNLEHLILESSTLATGLLLERLPKTLTHLELLNCWEITSEDMANFLSSHGNTLTHLTLKHCQSLSLGFLPVLGTSCPNLAHLEVDMTYFRHHASYADNKPDYATLLEVDQVPTWPSSIQSIEIIPMRNWTREAAEMFFDSLMKNAKALPNLRRLEFKVILNIDWRQRQEMRQSLADQMTRVFKRKSSPPMELRRLHQHNETKSEDVDKAEPSTSTSLRSSRTADRSSTLASNKNDAFAPRKRKLGKATGVPARRSVRALKSMSRFDADDEDSSEDELSAAHAGTNRSNGRSQAAKVADIQYNEIIQGLCDVVDIQVDNQRPAERQYDMDDFINSSEQSDPEWNSDEDSDEDDVLD